MSKVRIPGPRMTSEQRLKVQALANQHGSTYSVWLEGKTWRIEHGTPERPGWELVEVFRCGG